MPRCSRLYGKLLKYLLQGGVQQLVLDLLLLVSLPPNLLLLLALLARLLQELVGQ